MYSGCGWLQSFSSESTCGGRFQIAFKIKVSMQILKGDNSFNSPRFVFCCMGIFAEIVIFYKYTF